jgi:WD40 repeat protein
MKRLVSLIVILLFTISVTTVGSLNVVGASAAAGVRLLWTNSMEVNDVAVSGNGAYVAVVNDTAGGGALTFFASESPNPLWWWLLSTEVPLSVVVSFDGGQVAVGSSEGYVYYFDNSRTRTGLQSSSTWISEDLGGGIARRTIDISDDGQYVLVDDTGVAVYYFSGCRARSTSSEQATWLAHPQGSTDILALDLSPDGQYFAVGGTASGPGGFVAFYKHANAQPYPTSETWNAQTEIDDPVSDVKVSSDGHSVVAVSYLMVTTLYYWRDATNLSGDPTSTWNSASPYMCVDMSADGNQVVAGKPETLPGSIHFWTNANSLAGANRPETWVRHQGETVLDVAISRDGVIIAAVADPIIHLTGQYWTYFYTSDGTSIGEFQLDSFSAEMSMSADGGIVAVGGETIDSLYVFRVTRPVAVGGELSGTDYVGLLAPYVMYGMAVAAGTVMIVAVRKRSP